MRVAWILAVAKGTECTGRRYLDRYSRGLPARVRAMTFAELTFYLFTGFNALRLVSFAPQIWRVAHDEHGASAISYWSWSLWIATNASTGLYAFANLGDLVLAATNAVNALCCATVIVLTAYKRRHLAPRRHNAAAGIHV